MAKKKPFTVRVTAAKYNGWKSGPMFERAGGLWGLCIGARFMYKIRTKVQIKCWVPMDIRDKVFKKLQQWGDFDIEEPMTFKPRSPYWSKYAVSEEVVHLRSSDKEEQKVEAKELCQQTKAEVEEWLEEIFEDVGEFEPEDW